MGGTIACHVIPPSADAELDAFFEACPGSFAQQTTAWRDVIAPLGPDEPLFLGCRRADRLAGVLPAYRFEGPLGAILTSIPQPGALGGVAHLPGEDAEAVYAALIEAFLALARERGCALASVITNPFHADAERTARFLAPDFELENVTLALDLAHDVGPDGELSAGSSHARRNVRKAGSGPLRIDETQSEANVAAWYAIHASRHAAIGAPPLPRTLFEGALRHLVPREKGRFWFVRHTGTDQMVAGGLYLFHGEVIDAFMTAMTEEHAPLAPNYLLGAHTIRWAKARGLRWYNWEPSPPSGGVHRFKQQWGSREITYAYLTRVTGDASAFLASTPEEVSRLYPRHYVLPFDRIGARAQADRSPSTRRAAWTALSGEEP
jgi:hypothetical protein